MQTMNGNLENMLAGVQFLITEEPRLTLREAFVFLVIAVGSESGAEVLNKEVKEVTQLDPAIISKATAVLGLRGTQWREPLKWIDHSFHPDSDRERVWFLTKKGRKVLARLVDTIEKGGR